MSNQLPLLPFDRSMAKFGIPDFKTLNSKCIKMAELEFALDPSVFKKIQKCCANGSNIFGGCNHSLCPNCVNRKRRSLIREASTECWNRRLRGCFLTIAKAEWEADLTYLHGIHPASKKSLRRCMKYKVLQ